jgi:hypothetical protein
VSAKSDPIRLGRILLSTARPVRRSLIRVPPSVQPPTASVNADRGNSHRRQRSRRRDYARRERCVPGWPACTDGKRPAERAEPRLLARCRRSSSCLQPA